MASRKQRKVVLPTADWPGHTLEEQKAIERVIAAFGKVTVITDVRAAMRWEPFAKTRRCPECESWWRVESYPRCSWCGYREP